jgi:hypothetical protein
MNLRAEEHEHLNRLARSGSMPLGQGPDCIPASAAIRFAMAGLAQLVLRVGAQHAEITAQGKAFAHRGVC